MFQGLEHIPGVALQKGLWSHRPIPLGSQNVNVTVISTLISSFWLVPPHRAATEHRASSGAWTFINWGLRAVGPALKRFALSVLLLGRNTHSQQAWGLTVKPE